MPIIVPIPLRNLTQSEFDAVDCVVMQCAFASQNELGRFCDERIYENDVATRLRASGISGIDTQVPVMVRHDSFEKTYKLDLVADHALYELKTAAALAAQHDAQVLHYAMLTAVNHAKLLNFRRGRVQGRLVFNALTPETRRHLPWQTEAWRPLSDQCKQLRERLALILEDWGAHLETRLYEEALIHFFGGSALCARRVPVKRAGIELGTHAINSHADGLSFVLTSFTNAGIQRSHIRKLRHITGQKAVQWINLSRTAVSLETITD